ncbi:hypothetical protein GIB67_024987 [Kingdonia uniflora]|uniref:Uncharacterized protein n=1 Tax=Kingdonia uniflora TaxID=39325 RepID=A0A7J7N7R2_9MAGN|nr:hypothetical protein GIB67_024987 [Kingdonia uniflora]
MWGDGVCFYPIKCISHAWDIRVYGLDFIALVIQGDELWRRNWNCPNYVDEVVSSLLYASGRFGDLPELYKLCKVLKDCYGNIFVKTTVDLLPGNLVNIELTEKLHMEVILPFNAKYKLMNQITRDYDI